MIKADIVLREMDIKIQPCRQATIGVFYIIPATAGLAGTLFHLPSRYLLPQRLINYVPDTSDKPYHHS